MTNEQKQLEFQNYLIKNGLNEFDFFSYTNAHIHIFKKSAYTFHNIFGPHQIKRIATFIKRTRSATKIDYYYNVGSPRIQFDNFDEFKRHILIERLSGLI